MAEKQNKCRCFHTGHRRSLVCHVKKLWIIWPFAFSRFDPSVTPMGDFGPSPSKHQRRGYFLEEWYSSLQYSPSYLKNPCQGALKLFWRFVVAKPLTKITDILLISYPSVCVLLVHFCPAANVSPILHCCFGWGFSQILETKIVARNSGQRNTWLHSMVFYSALRLFQR